MYCNMLRGLEATSTADNGAQDRDNEKAMRKLVEITFMSLNGLIDAPDIVREAQPYFLFNDEHSSYQKQHIDAADALLLGRKTYEKFSKAYSAMTDASKGVPMDFVERMNSIPKYVASKTLKYASWNATILDGDIAEEVQKIKNRPGRDIVKYGTGPLDQVLFTHKLVDRLCIIVYPFALGRGTFLFEDLAQAMHLRLADVARWKSGAVVIEYAPNTLP
jgi:dihydrofolate reductase